MIRRVHVRTAGRLHFGLLSLPSEATPAQRSFGGVGLMVEANGIALSAERADRWEAEGELAERALNFARAYCDATRLQQVFRLSVVAAREHVGLGTGTQLGLAVARAIAALAGAPAIDAVTLAQQVGRGARSALGVHGFEAGGFLVEGGKSTPGAISPLLVRREFPDIWRVLLITPRAGAGLHGKRESEAFAELLRRPSANARITDELCRLVLLGILPALAEKDLHGFGDALFEFNRRSGEMFKSIQGGPYAHPHIAEIVGAVRKAGVKGVGQSSWGPTVFAIADVDELAFLRVRLVENFPSLREDEIILTKACNLGAEVTHS